MAAYERKSLSVPVLFPNPQPSKSVQPGKTMKSLAQLRKDLPSARRKKVEARTAKLIAEELTLQGREKRTEAD